MHLPSDAGTHQELSLASTNAAAISTVIPKADHLVEQDLGPPFIVPSLEAGDLDFDLDFYLDNILSEAQQVYSSEGTKALSSLGPEPNIVPLVQESIPNTSIHEEEVTSPELQTPPGPNPLVVERVNTILVCLNRPLEDITHDAELKIQLIDVLTFLNQKISTDVKPG
ncbi:hypothetical protein AHAS_Ahas03G0250700 [Arachis hypogaea]